MKYLKLTQLGFVYAFLTIVYFDQLKEILLLERAKEGAIDTFYFRLLLVAIVGFLVVWYFLILKRGGKFKLYFIKKYRKKIDRESLFLLGRSSFDVDYLDAYVAKYDYPEIDEVLAMKKEKRKVRF